MVALYSRRTAGGVAASLVQSLASIAKRDPLSDNKSHCDGVGYVALWKTGNGWEIDYHRYDAGKGSCTDNLKHMESLASHLSRKLKASEKSLIIFHARRASPGNPRGALNTHPFNAKIVAGGRPLELYLAHNGSLNKSSILTHMADHEIAPENWVDSHLYTIYMAEKLSTGEELSKVIESSKNLVETALDIAVLIIHGEKARLYFYSYINPKLGEEKKRYYSYFLLRRANLTAVIPSSLLSRSSPTAQPAARLNGLTIIGEVAL